MTPEHSDALVFFGATGDLAYKKIFPSLLAMVRRGTLNVPVIGVARSGWTVDQFQRMPARASRRMDISTRQRSRNSRRCCTMSMATIPIIATFTKLRAQLQDARHPAHYLAIPPALFGPVVEHLTAAKCTAGARVIVEKPFGHDQHLRARST